MRSTFGASFLVRKVIFEMLGGFDESFFVYSDGNDLCLRAWIYGYYVAYAPRLVVYHFGGGSSYRIRGRIESMPFVLKRYPSAKFYMTRKGAKLNKIKKLARRLNVLPEFVWFDSGRDLSS